MPAPIIIATWAWGRTAVEAGLPGLRNGGTALDAVVSAATAVENDPTVRSVGYGGLPDARGTVTLDACVMDGQTLDCGGVCAVEDIKNVAQLARRVMEQTPHVLLAGAGARSFALTQGFPIEPLITPEALAEWVRKKPKPGDPLGHDTVTILARDAVGNLAGACSTSGLGHKMPGRVGDSPLIGSGLYVDNHAGAAGATGVGEEVVRMVGAFFITERIAAGETAMEACASAVRKLNAIARRRGKPVASVAVLALDLGGNFGAACTPGTHFPYAVGTEAGVTMHVGPIITD